MFLRNFYELLINMSPGDALFFGDETFMELNRRLCRIWWIKGERPEIPVDSGRRRLNLIGAIDVKNNLGYFAEINKLNAVQFLRFLKWLLKSARIPGKMYLVLDNASSHHAKLVRPFLKKNMNRLELVFLLPYSPDFNPIEILWREIKKDINTNEYFQTLDELRTTLYEHFQQFKHPSENIASLWNLENWKSKVET